MSAAFEAVAVACGICGASCIPMADHDAPTCPHCDVLMERVLAGIQIDHRIRRPLASYYGPAPKQVIAELVDAICPRPVPNVSHLIEGVPA